MEKLSHICQLAILIVILSTVSLNTYAQDTTQKHIVERGETIESIAQQYGTTVDELVKLNPDASQFVYVGMELVVPAKAQINITSTTNYVKDENNHNDNSPQQIYTDIHNNASSNVDIYDFGFYGANYASNFDNAGCGYYSIGGQIFASSGWGAYFTIGANYGLVNSDYAGVMFKVGPTYGYAINDMFFLSFPLTFTGYYSGQGKEMKHVDTTQHYGINKGKPLSYDIEVSKDSKFNPGADFMPQIGVKLNKFIIHAGFDVAWAKGTKVNVGFIAGIGFTM